MQIVIFEDKTENLHPITLTRPACDILMGGLTLYQAVSTFSDTVILKTKRMCAFEPNMGKSKNKSGRAKNKQSKPTKQKKIVSGDVIFLNSRVVPDLKMLQKLEDLPKSSILKSGDSIVAARCPSSKIKLDKESSSDVIIHSLLKLKLKASRLKLELLTRPWEVMAFNEKLMNTNLKIISASYAEYEPNVFVGDDVEIHSTVSLDSSKGPIIIGSRTKIRPFSFLEGPLRLGDDCTINPHSWIRSFCSIGHTCKLGGEVESVSMQPYSNKQHFGFLGNSYVGSWVNLGAGTTNSDLKNTYGKIKIKWDRQVFETELQFLGCIIGDFSKTAINSTILTGSIIGVSSHLYGTVTEQVPSFTNYARDLGNLSELIFDSAVRTQKRMFERRGLKQTNSDREILKEVYDLTIPLRKRAGIPKMRLMFR